MWARATKSRLSIPVRNLTNADGEKLKAEFEKAYKAVYGLTIPNQQAEAITWSVTSSSPTPKVEAAKKGAKKGAAQALAQPPHL